MKLKYIFVALLAIMLASCSEDLMDRINVDKANPAGETVDGKFVIPGAIMNSAFNTISGMSTLSSSPNSLHLKSTSSVTHTSTAASTGK